MSPLLRGAAAGLAVAFVLAGALSTTDSLPAIYKVSVVAAAVAITAVAAWFFGPSAEARPVRSEPTDSDDATRVRESRPDEDATELAPGASARGRGEDETQLLTSARRVAFAPDADESAALLRKAQRVADGGEFREAALLVSDVIDAVPNHLGAHLLRGRLHLDLGDYNRAMSDFLTAENIAPEDPEPLVAVGDLYFARKEYRKAIERFDEALRLSPDHAMAHCRRGVCHLRLDDPSAALDDLLRAEALDREIPNLHTHVEMARKRLKRR